MKKTIIYPVCDKARCFACEKGKCELLTNNDFGDRNCPFFKTKEEVKKANKED